MKEVRIENYPNKRYQAAYFPTKKKMIVDLDSISYCFYNYYKETGLPLNSIYLIRSYNLNMINIIFHEIEHVLQTRQANEETKNDSLNTIVKEGIELGSRGPDNYTNKEKMLYRFFYRYILTEKNAEAMALMKILNVNNEIDILSMKEQQQTVDSLIKVLLKGYNIKKGRSASEYYYKLRGKLEEYKNISFEEAYDLLTKLSWGMPIEDTIYHQLNAKPDVKEFKKVIK